MPPPCVSILMVLLLQFGVRTILANILVIRLVTVMSIGAPVVTMFLNVSIGLYVRVWWRVLVILVFIVTLYGPVRPTTVM